MRIIFSKSTKIIKCEICGRETLANIFEIHGWGNWYLTNNGKYRCSYKCLKKVKWMEIKEAREQNIIAFVAIGLIVIIVVIAMGTKKDYWFDDIIFLGIAILACIFLLSSQITVKFGLEYGKRKNKVWADFALSQRIQGKGHSRLGLSKKYSLSVPVVLHPSYADFPKTGKGGEIDAYSGNITCFYYWCNSWCIFCLV